jgi:hypothetical protein
MKNENYLLTNNTLVIVHTPNYNSQWSLTHFEVLHSRAIPIDLWLDESWWMWLKWNFLIWGSAEEVNTLHVSPEDGNYITSQKFKEKVLNNRQQIAFFWFTIQCSVLLRGDMNLIPKVSLLTSRSITSFDCSSYSSNSHDANFQKWIN